MINRKKQCGHIWVDLPKYGGRYKVCECGEIKSIERISYTDKGHIRLVHERILKKHIGPGGYWMVSVYDGKNNKKDLFNHRAVGLTFIPNPDNKPFINHKDGNKLNCNRSNLEWATRDENEKHARENGLKPTGEEHCCATITNNDVLEIRRLRKQGKRIKDIAANYNLSDSHVSAIALGKYWKKVMAV